MGPEVCRKNGARVPAYTTDMLFTSLHWLILRKNEKEDNSVMDLQNFTKVNQVIYTLDTICNSNIMTLAQAVLDIFCLVIMRKKQKEDNSVTELHNFAKS